MEGSIRRVPAMEDAEVKKFFNGPEAFTPDGEFILGESEVPGFWVAAGFCAHGLAGAGGIGKVMAEWIVDGQPEWDLWHMDIRRFGRQYRSPALHARPHGRGLLDLLRHQVPGRGAQGGAAAARLAGLSRGTPRTARASARSPAGSASTGSSRTHGDGDESLRPRGWAGRNWSPAIEAECLAAGERAVLIDQSSFAKIDVHGPGACAFLDRMCANAVDRPVGSVIYTQLLNAAGASRPT